MGFTVCTVNDILCPSTLHSSEEKIGMLMGGKKTIIGNGLHWSYMSVWQTHHRHCLLCLAVFFLLFCIFCFRCLSWTWRTVLVYIWWCLFCQCTFFCPCISPDSLTESWRSGLQQEIPSVSCMMDALNPRLLPPLGCSGSSDEPPIQVHQNTHTDSPNTVFFTDPELKHTCMTHNASKSVDRAPAALATADSYQFCPSDHPKELLNICAWWSGRYCQVVGAVCALVETIQMIMIYLARWRWSSVKFVIWLFSCVNLIINNNIFLCIF